MTDEQAIETVECYLMKMTFEEIRKDLKCRSHSDICDLQDAAYDLQEYASDDDDNPYVHIVYIVELINVAFAEKLGFDGSAHLADLMANEPEPAA